MAYTDRKIKRAIFGFRRFRDIRFREALFNVLNFPKQNKGVKLKIYDRDGIKLQEIGDDIQNNILGKVRFELIERGCGAFSFELKGLPSIDIEFTHRVDIHLFGDVNPWFSGEVFKLPETGTTERPYKYSGFGYAYQLDTTRINQAYNSTAFPASSDREIGKIVKHLMTNFIEPNSDIVYNEFKIESPGFEVTDINFDRISAKQALEKLKDIAQNFIYGVDEKRELFFKAVDSEVNQDAIRFVGKHINSFKPKQPDSSAVVNVIDIVSGLITSGSNYIATVEDTDSQDTYGKRWAKLSIPEALNINDAERWGNYRLSQLKNPKKSAKLKNVDIIDQTRIAAEGKARIFDIDGTAHEFYIKKVIYTSSERGISMDWHLGEIDIPFEEGILDMIRDIKNQEVLQASNVEQLSS